MRSPTSQLRRVRSAKQRPRKEIRIKVMETAQTALSLTSTEFHRPPLHTHQEMVARPTTLDRPQERTQDILRPTDHMVWVTLQPIRQRLAIRTHPPIGRPILRDPKRLQDPCHICRMNLLGFCQQIVGEIKAVAFDKNTP
eukprot:scaffold463506_cov46-Prasinocladus_malaysianus.AAC.1